MKNQTLYGNTTNLNQATEELWQKIIDMNTGTNLTRADWLEILSRLEVRIKHSHDLQRVDS